MRKYGDHQGRSPVVPEAETGQIRASPETVARKDKYHIVVLRL